MDIRPTIAPTTRKILREKQRVENIKAYLEQNPAADLHAFTVAGVFKLSTSFFLHLFKRYEQQPYRSYLEALRMQKAFGLLQKEGMRVKEVMYATGYKNRTTFNKAFKKKFRYPPGYFKK